MSTLAGRHIKKGHAICSISCTHALFLPIKLAWISSCQRSPLCHSFFFPPNTWYPSTVFFFHSLFCHFFTYPSGWESRFLPGLSLEWGNPHPLPPYPPPSFSSSLVSFPASVPASKVDSCTSHSRFSWGGERRECEPRVLHSVTLLGSTEN